MRKEIVLSVGFLVALSAALLLWHQGKVSAAKGTRLPSSTLSSGASQPQRSASPNAQQANPLVASPALQPRAADATNPRMLPAESRFFANGKLSLSALQESMTGEGFAAQMAALERQSAIDESASALTRAYDSALFDLLRTAGLDRGQRQVACGLSLCLGSLTSDSDSATYERWWSDFEHSPAAPHTIGVDYTVDLGGGLYEHRFAFVTDPLIKDYRARLGR